MRSRCLPLLIAGALVALSCFTPPQASADAPPPRGERDRYGDPLPAAAVARLGTLRLRHPRQNCAVFSPDGKALATAGDDRVVRLWDIATGRERCRFDGHVNFIRALAFAPNGKLLISAGVLGEVRIWDLATGKQLHQLEGNRAAVSGLALSGDSHTLAMISGNGYVHVWDTTTGKLQRTFRAAPDPAILPCLALSPDGKFIATSASRRAILMWDTSSGKELCEVNGSASGARSLAFTSDGKQLVSGNWDGTVRVHDPANGKELRVLNKIPGSVLRLVRTFGGKDLIVAGGQDKTVGVWDLSTGKELTRVTAHAVRPVSFLDLSPDGKHLVAGNLESLALRIWDAEGKELHERAGHAHGVEALAFSPDERSIITGGRDGLLVWGVDGKFVRRLADHKHGARALAFSPDGKVLASGGMNSAVHFWGLPAGTERQTYKGHDFWIGAIAFAPDGKVFAASANTEVVLRETNTGKEVARLKGHYNIGGVAFAPNGKTLAVGSSRGVHLWGLPAGEDLGTIQAFKDVVTDVAFAPEPAEGPQLLASVGWDRTVRLYDVGKKAVVAAMKGHKTRVWSVAFSPDGRLLASGDEDGEWRLWETATGEELAVIRSHNGPVHALSFSPSGTRLASGSDDGTALVWDVSTLLGNSAPAAAPSKRELESLWAQLADKDARKAYRAIRVLSAAPTASLTVMREYRSREVPDNVKQLLKQLDSDEFAVRERASADLEELGQAAVPGLRRALAGKPSVEVSKRVRQLLAKVRGETPSAERLRWLRAVLVLERSATPEARKMLEELAKTSPEAEVVQQARAALRRSNRSPERP